MTVAKKSITSKKNAPKKPATKVKLVKDTSPEISTDKMISEAAYYLAMQRDFSDGDPMQDWLQAEQAIQQQLNIHQ